MINAKSLLAKVHVERAQRAQEAQIDQPCGDPEGAREAHKGANPHEKVIIDVAVNVAGNVLRPDVPLMRPVENGSHTTFAPHAPHAPLSGGFVSVRMHGGDPSKPSPNPFMSQRAFGQVQALTWTDEDIERFVLWHSAAVRIGVPSQTAEYYAEQMLWRDMVGDDRQACAECASYRHRHGGVKGRCTLTDGVGLSGGEQDFYRLRRCGGFSGRVTK